MPRFRDRSHMRLTIIIQLLPHCNVSFKMLSESLKSRQITHTANLIPWFVRQPRRIRIGDLFNTSKPIDLSYQLTLLSRPTPPVKKNINSCLSISFLALQIHQCIRHLNRNHGLTLEGLSREQRKTVACLFQTVTDKCYNTNYKWNVQSSISNDVPDAWTLYYKRKKEKKKTITTEPYLCHTNSRVNFKLKKHARKFSRDDYLSLMEIKKRFTNHTREYWYMGSMLGKSVIEKKSTEPCCAMGR